MTSSSQSTSSKSSSPTFWDGLFSSGSSSSTENGEATALEITQNGQHTVGREDVFFHDAARQHFHATNSFASLTTLAPQQMLLPSPLKMVRLELIENRGNDARARTNMFRTKTQSSHANIHRHRHQVQSKRVTSADCTVNDTGVGSKPLQETDRNSELLEFNEPYRLSDRAERSVKTSMPSENQTDSNTAAVDATESSETILSPSLKSDSTDILGTEHTDRKDQTEPIMLSRLNGLSQSESSSIDLASLVDHSRKPLSMYETSKLSSPFIPLNTQAKVASSIFSKLQEKLLRESTSGVQPNATPSPQLQHIAAIESTESTASARSTALKTEHRLAANPEIQLASSVRPHKVSTGTPQEHWIAMQEQKRNLALFAQQYLLSTQLVNPPSDEMFGPSQEEAHNENEIVEQSHDPYLQPFNQQLHPLDSPVTVRIPQDHDILFGRGPRVNKHPGNVRFRSIINQYRDLYARTTAAEKKTAISHMLVGLLKTPFTYKGGTVIPRFLRYHEELAVWEVVPDDIARKKISHRLRAGKSSFQSSSIR